MKKPSFQFYPGDWRKDQNLSRASLQAKGAMIEIMCLAFECDKRGVLATDGQPWTIEEIAHAIGGDKMTNIAAIDELLKLNVLKKNKKNFIFSSRMVKDSKILDARKKGGQLGKDHGFKGKEFGKLGGRGVKKPPLYPPPSSSSSSSTSVNKEEIQTAHGLEKSNLFRKPKIPTIDQVAEVFYRSGGTREMAEAFFGKHDSTGWYLNGSPIVNYVSLVPKFIQNWGVIQTADPKKNKNSWI